MSPRKRKCAAPVAAPRSQSRHERQRQKLIDACISALHLHGPSRTTVEKVVAIAKMSPGIVRFYFDSKAALLVASLKFLATEFEDRLLVPVTALKRTPVAALELLLDLYLDPEIASARKVSVWYAFWGEASSRQEYYDICGQKDERFARLVHELIERLIAQTAHPHLDPDGIALGLSGVLEVLWQDFAFRSERDIDRAAAKRRAMAFLSSVFPGSFANAPPAVAGAACAASVLRSNDRFEARAYADPRLHVVERDTLFRDAWVALGHAAELPRSGDFITRDLVAERVLVLRDEQGTVHAFRNNCPAAPHALVLARRGRLRRVECPLHGLHFALDGASNGDGRVARDLERLEVQNLGEMLFVRPAFPLGRIPHDRASPPPCVEAPVGLRRLVEPLELPVAADWKVIVETWLDASLPPRRQLAPVAGLPPPDSLVWHCVPGREDGWSTRLYAALLQSAAVGPWRRQFFAPNLISEIRPDGMSVVQVMPSGPGHSRLLRWDYTLLGSDDKARAVLHLARRMSPYLRRSRLDVAESIQRGMVDFGYAAASAPAAPRVGWFRRLLIERVPALAAAPDGTNSEY